MWITLIVIALYIFVGAVVTFLWIHNNDDVTPSEATFIHLTWPIVLLLMLAFNITFAVIGRYANHRD